MSAQKETVAPGQGSDGGCSEGKSELRQGGTVEGADASTDAAIWESRVREDASGSGSSVTSSSLETSVPNAPRSWHVFEGRRREKLAPERARWKRRAADMASDGDVPRTVYAMNRVASLGRDLEPTVSQCGKRARDMRCGCKGAARPSRDERAVEFNCKQHLVCGRCMRKRSHKLRAKMGAALQHHLDVARRSWVGRGCPRGGKPIIVMMTFTIAHSGDVMRDRRDLQEGWREFWKRLKRRGWAQPYCGAWEATSGRDRLGHPHLHVAMVWPFRDFGFIRRLWRASCPRSERIHFGTGKKRRDGAPTNGKSAAAYIGKYISKGVDLDTMGEVLAADIVAATYNQKTVISGTGQKGVKFWLPWERPHCECCGVLPWPDVPLRPWTSDEMYSARARERQRCIDVLGERYGPSHARWIADAAGSLHRLIYLTNVSEYADRSFADRATRIETDMQAASFVAQGTLPV